MSSSEGVRVGGTITISGIPRDLVVVAAAAACPSVEWVPAQLCPSQSQDSSRSQGNQEYAPEYVVQCIPNTGSLMSSPPPSLPASVQ